MMMLLCIKRNRSSSSSFLATILLCVGVFIRPSISSSDEHHQSRVLCNDLNFTSKVCQDYGLLDQFDVCAVLEVCSENNGNNNNEDGRRRRDLQGGEGEFIDQDEGWWADSNESGFAKNVETAQLEEKEEEEEEDEELLLDPPEFDEGQEDEVRVPDSADGGNTSSSSSSSPPVNVASFGYRVAGDTTCSYPGPTMRFQQGKNHAVLVRNTVPSSVTNLHFHGLHMKSTGNGDNVLREIPSDVEGLTVYEVDLKTVPHMGGTHWYHPHIEKRSWDQVQGGAFGMIVVEDDFVGDQTMQDPKVADFLAQQERILILSNTEGSKAWRGNGIKEGQETIKVRKDAWIRLRILMVNVDSHSSGGLLKFDSTSCPNVLPIAHDGILRHQVPASESQYEYYLTSASRLDVALQCTSTSKIRLYDYHVATIEMVSQDDGEEAGPTSTATPYVNGDQVWNPTRPPYLRDMMTITTLADVDDDNNSNDVLSFKIHVDETNINNHHGIWQPPVCPKNQGGAAYFEGIQEWTISGANTHPFHLHTFPMQVVNDKCGAAHDEGEFYDTIVTAHGGSSRCKVRINFADLAGPTLMHCHIFEHAEHGAMTYIPVGGGDFGSSSSSSDVMCTAPNDCPTPEKTLQTSCSGSNNQDRQRRDLRVVSQQQQGHLRRSGVN